MKQFQFEYQSNEEFVNSIKRIKQWCNTSVVSNVLFQIYSETLDKSKIHNICEVIWQEMPEALYMGSSTNGNIINGEKSEKPITIICTVYEYPSTKVKLLQYVLNADTAADVAGDLIRITRENPWVKSIMTYTTMRGMSMSDYCDFLSDLPKHVVFCGGGAFSEDINDDSAYVFSSKGPISDHAAVFILTGGEDYYVRALHVTGWKPLGRNLKVTKAKGPVLKELDGEPAYKTYFRYLNINNDENFFTNTLEFPFLYELYGNDILRAPIACTEDGSLVMTADIAENANAKIAYGDPWTILESVDNAAASFRDFVPQTFTVFSCAGRRTFWGDDEISTETKPFQSIAPTSGFYTSGEFLRNGDHVIQHNVTLVVEAQREGPISTKGAPKVDVKRSDFSGKVSMINRLATFIQAATEELEEANRRLKLSSITDGLTGLYNRTEIQRRISEKVNEFEAYSAHGKSGIGAALIMMDIDNFKSVNDNYGHNEGDRVLIGLSDMIRETLIEFAPEASAGRWGGEEFMILCPEMNKEKAVELAEILRMRFSELDFPFAGKRTMSLGVTEMIAGENSDICCVRVDDALYEAKRTGKNKIVTG